MATELVYYGIGCSILHFGNSGGAYVDVITAVEHGGLGSLTAPGWQHERWAFVADMYITPSWTSGWVALTVAEQLIRKED